MKQHSLLLLIFLLNACRPATEQQKTDLEFYIPVEKSNLYVRVVGNVSGPLVINLHGGPGAFSGFDHEFNRKYLEDDYLFVYLDQRGGGKSGRCTDSTMLTMDQFVEDLNVVVDSLQNRYEGKKINLLGSSWGGTLGLLYLIEHQEKINSFVCVSGKADGMYPVRAIIEHERELARSLMKRAQDTAARNRYHRILVKLEAIAKSDFRKFFNDMNLLKHDFPKKLGFNAYWADSAALDKAVMLGKDSSYFARAHYTKEEYEAAMRKFEFVNRVFRNTPAYNHLNIIDEIGIIRKPVLVLQGEYDYAIGVKQGGMIYNALEGVPDDKKELHILPDAAHNLNLEAQEQYYQTVELFLDKHNR